MTKLYDRFTLCYKEKIGLTKKLSSSQDTQSKGSNYYSVNNSKVYLCG